jgi:hypothetical protein
VANHPAPRVSSAFVNQRNNSDTLRRKGKIMPDDLTKRGEPDRDRVNVHEDWERKRWAKDLGVSEDKLKEAVRKVGPMVKDVKKELGK